MKKFLIINGPNLNCLGRREREIYGDMTLCEIKKHTEEMLKVKKVKEDGIQLQWQLQWFQSNGEGEIVGRIQEAMDQDFTALIINPGGYSHTSVAIMDALKMLPFPIVEVHLSNTQTREEFRSRKLTGRVAASIIEGLGKNTYYLAVYSQLVTAS